MPEITANSAQQWTILFDLDGTLVETAPDLCAAVNHVIGGEGLAPIELAQIRGMIGEGARALIRKAYALQDARLSQDIEDVLFADLLVFYAKNIANNSFIFPHIVETLDLLKRDGARLAVCTNKMQGLSEILLDALDLTRYFPVVLGADKTSAKKPDRTHIWETITLGQGDPAKAIMIGDSNTDAKAAAAANVPFILLEYGYHGGKLDEIQADIKLKDAAPLYNSITQIIRSSEDVMA